MFTALLEIRQDDMQLATALTRSACSREIFSLSKSHRGFNDHTTNFVDGWSHRCSSRQMDIPPNSKFGRKVKRNVVKGMGNRHRIACTF